MEEILTHSTEVTHITPVLPCSDKISVERFENFTLKHLGQVRRMHLILKLDKTEITEISIKNLLFTNLRLLSPLFLKTCLNYERHFLKKNTFVF